jgi:hypothetical protein
VPSIIPARVRAELRILNWGKLQAALSVCATKGLELSPAHVTILFAAGRPVDPAVPHHVP